MCPLDVSGLGLQAQDNSKSRIVRVVLPSASSETHSRLVDRHRFEVDLALFTGRHIQQTGLWTVAGPTTVLSSVCAPSDDTARIGGSAFRKHDRSRLGLARRCPRLLHIRLVV